MYDHLCGGHWFGVSMANAGDWEDDDPLYARVLSGTYGGKVLDGTHWILFCGEQDYNEMKKKYVCDGMETTQDRLTQQGASVDLFLRDPQGDHESFMTTEANRDQALDFAETLAP